MRGVYGREGMYPLILLLVVDRTIFTHVTLRFRTERTASAAVLIIEPRIKRPIHSQFNCAILLCVVIPDGKTE